MDGEANKDDGAQNDMSEKDKEDVSEDDDEDREASETASEEEVSTLGAAQPAEEVGARVQEFAQANLSAAQPAAEDQSDFEEANPEEALRTKALSQTTSAHDDWLHRVPGHVSTTEVQSPKVGDVMD